MKLNNSVLPERTAFALRLAVGVVFGLLLAWLGHHAFDPARHKLPNVVTWQNTAYTTLLLTAFIWWAGAGTVRRLALATWGIAATIIVACLSWHQISNGTTDQVYAFMTPAGFLVLPLLFVANELVSSGDRADKLIAPYATYFDQAWKHGVQLGLSLLFTGLFWAILWLGAALLGLIGFHWLKDLLEKDWFHWPACGAAMACAVQLGDVQDKLLTNVRALVLSVLSWLLPVIAVIGLLFLGSLCLSGLAPLWKTKAASVTLLSASIAFVLLINAAYQQGDAERPVHIVMKWAARLAAFLLLAFAALAAYSLWLRIDQYGLTPERVLAAAGVIIAVLFGLGYVAAAVWPGRWLMRVETVNIAMAFVKVLIFLGLLTPLADPARLGVADQVARLQSGRTAPNAFDWRQLRYETGHYGTAALKTLTTAGHTKDIRAAAVTAVAWKDEDRFVVKTERWVVDRKSDDLSRLKVVSPAGAVLPATFDGMALEPQNLRDCVDDPSMACTAALVDLDGDGVPEIAVLKGNDVTIFQYQAKGWQSVPMGVQYLDQDDVKAFNAGQVMAKPHAWSDLKVGGTRLMIDGDK